MSHKKKLPTAKSGKVIAWCKSCQRAISSNDPEPRRTSLGIYCWVCADHLREEELFEYVED